MGADHSGDRDKLIELAYTWGDIEERIEIEAAEADNPISDEQFLAYNVGRAFRVEAVFGRNSFDDPCTYYVLLYDVADAQARKVLRELNSGQGLTEPLERRLRGIVNELAQPCHSNDNLIIKAVARSTPVEGQICRRLGEEHPPKLEPTLDDLPVEQPSPQAQAGYVKRDGYWLTGIEAKFYDAARDVGNLFFAVQPWIQGTDRRYRPDFVFFYDGRPHVVELDGHEWHKTKEQRGADAARERWFEERGLRVHRFTGSQVHADPQGCVSELLNLLRSAAARP